MRVEGKVGVPRDREVVDREGVEHLRRFDLVWDSLCGADLGETIGDIEDEDNEETVGGALDLEVTEE